jgi:hypothetical protein
VSAGIPEPDTPVDYGEHFRPLFRENDRESMRFAFDLWSYEDVSANATAIFEKVRTGATPCDGPWPSERGSLTARRPFPETVRATSAMGHSPTRRQRAICVLRQVTPDEAISR